jgi:ribosome biogenesis protein ENP2
MPNSSQTIKMSNDGQYILATGVYKPTIKLYDTKQLSMKFERRADAEVVQSCILGDDWQKFALLLADRNIDFHAPYGKHHSCRTPKNGRDMVYHPGTCDLIIGASSSDVYRLNLDQVSDTDVVCSGAHNTKLRFRTCTIT